jgi:hypothetical protein
MNPKSNLINLANGSSYKKAASNIKHRYYYDLQLPG